MKLATLACLAALCLIGPGAHAAPGEPPRTDKAPPARTEPPRADQPGPDGPRPDPARTDPAKPEPARSDQPRPAPARSDQSARSDGRPAGGARERRRRSYAACNRASHLRDLRGGRRRRFLIRCRLGYERTRAPQVQAPGAAPAAPQPGRKP